MAKTPVQARRGFYYKPNRNLNTLVPFDWNVVDTELGTMVEPRNFAGLDPTSKVVQIDIIDAAYDSVTVTNQDTFYAENGVGGQLIVGDFNY